jgi:DNA-binding IclR family transcriptional regulator
VGEAVKSADRVLQIIELLAGHPAGITQTEIHQRLGLPKSSTHALLATMVSRGFLEQDPQTRGYRVGIRLWQAGQSYLPATDLEKSALPYMEALRDEVNETVQLAVLDGIENVYIAKVDPDQQLRLASRVGIRLPAHVTGVGKALLSGLTDDEVRHRFRDVEFVRHTAQSLTTLDHLIAELHEIRARGYALDNAEHTPGVYCVAAPIHDARGATQAAISVAVPDVRRTPDLIDKITTATLHKADALSQRLGFNAPR